MGRRNTEARGRTLLSGPGYANPERVLIGYLLQAPSHSTPSSGLSFPALRRKTPQFCANAEHESVDCRARVAYSSGTGARGRASVSLAPQQGPDAARALGSGRPFPFPSPLPSHALAGILTQRRGAHAERLKETSVPLETRWLSRAPHAPAQRAHICYPRTPCTRHSGPIKMGKLNVVSEQYIAYA